MKKIHLPVRIGLGFAALILLGVGCSTVDQGPTTTGPAGMFVSLEKGESWKPVSTMPTLEGNKSLLGASVYKLIADPQDPSGLYWASRDNGLFYSFDGGNTWKQSLAPFTKGFVYAVAVHPKDKCIIYATNGRQVFKTEDCTRSWAEVYEEVRSDSSVRTLAFDPFAPYSIYMGVNNGDLYSSGDQGRSWKLATRFKSSLSEIAFDGQREGLMYAGLRNAGLSRSFDKGATWTNISDKMSGFPGSLEFRRILVYPSKPNQIYWVSKYGILTSRNAGEDWDAFQLVTPPGSVNIYGFAVNPHNDQDIYYTATYKERSTFYRSEDGGKSWITRKLPSQQLPTALYVHPQHDSWVYVGFTIPPKQ